MGKGIGRHIALCWLLLIGQAGAQEDRHEWSVELGISARSGDDSGKLAVTSDSRSIGPRASQREIRLIASAYYGNDPAGALLSWRGWAIHERQSRIDDALRLPPVPQIQPGMMFEKQAPFTEPFEESDHAPGYYYGAEWRPGRRLLLTAMHYDNHADPVSLRHGQYGWTTRFDHIGAQLDLPARLGLVLQWMDGTTVMGPVINGTHVVDNGFNAAFALLTRQHGRHRWSIRFDDFEMVDYDGVPLDDNSESGDAVTLAWRYETDGGWTAGVEWNSIDVRRPAFGYFDRPITSSEDVVRFDLRYSLGRPTR